MSNELQPGMILTKYDLTSFFQDGTWFRFHVAFLKEMEVREAVVINFLLNQLGLYWKTAEKNNGWFPLPRKDLEFHLHLDRNSQSRSLEMLKEMGYIKSHQLHEAGRFARRYVKVNLDKVWETIKAFNLQRLKSERTVTHFRVTESGFLSRCSPGESDRKEIERKEKTVALARSGLVEVDFEKKVIEKLHTAILEEFGIFKNTRNWRKTIVQMQRFDRISQKRIKHAVIWYSKHIGEMFVPHIEDAQDFRRKFAALEKRMAEEKPTKPEAIEVPEEIKPLLKDLREDLQWPKGSRAQLTEVVVKSWQNLQAFRSKVYELGQKGDGQVETFAAGQVEMRGYGVRYLRIWFERYNARLKAWAEWSGNLAMTVWSLDHKDFIKELSDDAAEYSANPEKYVSAIRKLFQ